MRLCIYLTDYIYFIFFLFVASHGVVHSAETSNKSDICEGFTSLQVLQWVSMRKYI